MTDDFLGYQRHMTDPRPADHEMGVELQIIELVEQRTRAEVQGRTDDVARIQAEIDALQEELAHTAEHIARRTVMAQAVALPRLS